MAQTLGLDIDENTIRAALVRSSFRTHEVVRYLEVPRSRLSEDPSAHAEADALRGAVADLLSQISPVPDQIVTAIDGREVSLRVIDLPAGAAKRIAEVLPFQLEELLPFDMADAVVSHQIMSRGEVEIKVLTAAASNGRVETELATLSDAGLDPREIAVGAAALDTLPLLVPGLKGSEEDTGGRLLIDIRSDHTDLCILKEGRCIFARTLTGGLDLLRAQEQEELGLEIRRTLAAYRAQGGEAPSEGFLVGEASLYADAMLPWLSEHTGVGIETILMPEAPGADGSRQPLFARAVSLGARLGGGGNRINLRQGVFAHTRAMGAFRTHLKALGIAAAVVLFAFFYSAWAKYSVASEENDALLERLAQVTDQTFDEETRDPSRARELLEGGREVADPLPGFTAFDALEAISAAIPGEIVHNTRRLNIEVDDTTREGQFEIQGTVASLAERDTIAANFEQVRCFREIDRGPTSPAPNEGLNYRLEGEIQCPGDAPPVEEEGSRRRRRRRGR